MNGHERGIMFGMRTHSLVSRFGLGIVIALGAIGGSASTSRASTPRVGDQCKPKEAGMVVGLLVCAAPQGTKYVWIRLLRTAGPAKQSTESPACDPNYYPCVPISSDVDCAGGSGNGPAYAYGPVRVIGSDIYGLDRDGDGIGCESSAKVPTESTPTSSDMGS